MGQHLADLAT
ncbi:unnamed protein product, partial [Didymodactylos carnosus]